MADEVRTVLGAADILDVMKLLPHRYPFLLIDKIIDIDGDNSATGIKNVTVNEPYFTGHFPGRPIMPGVLIVEAMAQTAGAICARSKGDGGCIVYFMTIDNARFRKPVVPGDRLEIFVVKQRQRGNVWKFHCEAKVDDALVAEADVGAMMISEGAMSLIADTAKIHPLSVIEDGAVIGENVVVGPFSHVGSNVTLHDGVVLMSHVIVLGRSSIGRGTKIWPAAVIGGDSQSAHHSALDTTLTVGENCTIREGVTMNTGTVEHGGATIIGNNNLFLAYAHVAHDCRLGNNIILSNNVMLAGHVHIDDRAILGGGSAVHQFTRIGRQAFIGGLAAVHFDVIPYGMLSGNPGVLGGLNVVGMTRAGMDRAEIHKVRRAYKQIFEAEGPVRANAEAIRAEFADCRPVIDILDFIAFDSDRALSSPNRGK